MLGVTPPPQCYFFRHGVCCHNVISTEASSRSIGMMRSGEISCLREIDEQASGKAEISPLRFSACGFETSVEMTKGDMLGICHLERSREISSFEFERPPNPKNIGKHRGQFKRRDSSISSRPTERDRDCIRNDAENDIDNFRTSQFGQRPFFVDNFRK